MAYWLNIAGLQWLSGSERAITHNGPSPGHRSTAAAAPVADPRELPCHPILLQAVLSGRPFDWPVDAVPAHALADVAAWCRDAPTWRNIRAFYR